MPSSLQTLDTSFPKIDDHKTTEENFHQVTNYLYMLLENLRYTLGNLGEENFNDTELDSIAKLIQEPVWARIEDDEGNIHTLNVTAQNLLSQISDINGGGSSIQQTGKSLLARVQDIDGGESSIDLTGKSILTRVKDSEGNISKISQTVNGITLSVSNEESSSTIKLMRDGVAVSSQKIEFTSAKGISLSVSNGTSSSTIKLMSGSTVISSKSISFSGMVTFSDLSTSGSTTINGSNIKTGLISSDYIRLYGEMYVYAGKTGEDIGGSIGYMKSSENDTYGISLRQSGGSGYTATKGEVSATVNGSKMTFLYYLNKVLQYNQIYIAEDNAGIFIGDSKYYASKTAFYNQNKVTLGTSSYLWGQIYSSNSAISQSDANRKNSIESLPEKYLTMFDRLIPRRYKLNDGTSDRYHVGFVAQEVEAAMTAAGVDSQEFGGFVKDTDEETGEDIYFLRYEEFIAILVAKINALENKIDAFGNNINALEVNL